jgi:hypothetical protein
VLAVVAAIRRVGLVLGAIELGGVNDFMAKPGLARNGDCELPMAIGITGAISGNAQD